MINVKEYKFGQFKIESTKKEHIPAVLELVESEPAALLPVPREELLAWIEKGHSVVLKAGEQIIGHQAVGIWPKSGWVELRAAVVKSEFRGNGLNTWMKQVLIEIMQKESNEVTFVGFTEKESMSRGIFKNLGFSEIPLSETPAEFFLICPDSCILKTGVECGCKVFVLRSNNN